MALYIVIDAKFCPISTLLVLGFKLYKSNKSEIGILDKGIGRIYTFHQLCLPIVGIFCQSLVKLFTRVVCTFMVLN